MLKQTPLHEMHVKQHALMVDFAGWEMPLHYGSQIEEHHAVRNDAGMFDVSHMGVVDVQGDWAYDFLRYLLANDVGKLKSPGRALYTCMLNEKGGVIDDLIVYFIAPTHYRLVVNAATTEKDVRWMQQHAEEYQAKGYELEINLRQDTVIMAVQGPKAIEKISQAFPQFKTMLNSLKPFRFAVVPIDASDFPTNLAAPFSIKEGDFQFIIIARTGYTGEDGVEIIMQKEWSVLMWTTLLKAEISPIGLGARDTLRLEAGLNLYGQDMDENVTPLESNLSWTVAFTPPDRDFIGKTALMADQKQGIGQQLVGLVLLDKGVLRHDQSIFAKDEFLGKITSGSFSPTLKQSIGLARIRVQPMSSMPPIERCEVEIRNRRLEAKIVQPPFVRRKKL